MGVKVGVDTDDITTKAQKVQSGVAEMEAQLGSLQGSINELQATWTGNASTAFHSMYEDWNKSAAQMKQALEGIGRSLNSAGHNYDQLEQQLVSQFSG